MQRLAAHVELSGKEVIGCGNRKSEKMHRYCGALTRNKWVLSCGRKCLKWFSVC
jgi:hypothetical protein